MSTGTCNRKENLLEYLDCLTQYTSRGAVLAEEDQCQLLSVLSRIECALLKREDPMPFKELHFTSTLVPVTVMLIYSNHKFVCYGASKCLKKMLVHLTEEQFKYLVKELFAIIANREKNPLAAAQSCDVLKSILKRSGQADGPYTSFSDTTFTCFIGVGKKIFDDIMESTAFESNESCIMIHSLMSLWNNILKYMLKTKPNPKPVSNCVLPALELLLSILRAKEVPLFCQQKAFSILRNGVEVECNDSTNDLCLELANTDASSVVNPIPYVSNNRCFGGSGWRMESTILGADNGQVDIRCLRKAVIAFLKSIIHSLEDGKVTGIDALGRTVQLADELEKIQLDGSFLCKHSWPVYLYNDQDDQMLEVMMSILKVHNLLLQTLSSNERGEGEMSRLFLEKLEPNMTFLHFLCFTSWDHSLLLDLLISPETIFLEYFLRYLKRVVNNWKGFCSDCEQFSKVQGIVPKNQNINDIKRFEEEHIESCNSPLPKRSKLIDYSSSDTDNADEENSSDQQISATADRETSATTSISCAVSFHREGSRALEDSVSVFIRLNLAIQRLQTNSLFPYNPKPLLSLLDNVESLYESQSDK